MAASFDLLHEGAPHSAALTILGMIIGALFIKASQDYLSQVWSLKKYESMKRGVAVYQSQPGQPVAGGGVEKGGVCQKCEGRGGDLSRSARTTCRRCEQVKVLTWDVREQGRVGSA
eukprot:354338-Chlamydomonas_euryale.AAC.3